jgi:hypothetical protein
VTCTIEQCDRTVRARGLCSAHYRAAQRGTFDPSTGRDDRSRVVGRPFEQRLASRVIVSDCWVWTGAKVYGYGRINAPGFSTLAHRWVWENLVGPIPDGLTLDHLCRNRACVNPDHLEPVPMKINAERGAGDWTPGTCKHGHGPEDRHRAPSGQTYCRACRARRERNRPDRNVRALKK